MTILYSGLALGALYALVAMGYAVTYIASGVVNFAQGYLVMLGTYLSYLGLNTWSLPLWVTIVGAAVCGGLVNIVIERVCIRPLRNRAAHSEMITTVGAATLITGIISLVWGSNVKGVAVLQNAVPRKVLGGLLSLGDLWLFAAVVVCGLGLILLSNRTRIGIISLAVAEDREAATLRGINVNMLSFGAFFVAGVLACVVGPLVGVKTSATLTLGPILAVKGFVVFALGGIRSFTGALLCGLAIGVLEAYAGRYVNGSAQDLVTYVVFIGVLLILPAGLFGRRQERLV
jgi:branched-chain amino acid transport system permease protein